MRSRKDYVFALTSYDSEAGCFSTDEVTIRLCSSVATYGYDGLSAYEIAVMRGDFSGTEGEFLEWCGFARLKTINGQSLRGSGNIDVLLVRYLSVDEYASLPSIDKKTMYILEDEQGTVQKIYIGSLLIYPQTGEQPVTKGFPYVFPLTFEKQLT